MLNKTMISMAFLAAGLMFSAPSAWGQAPTGCTNSAQSMLTACGFDVRDDFYTTSANCQNIARRADRRPCRIDAATIRDEETDACDEVYDARIDACDLLQESRYDPDPLADPANSFIDPNDVPNIVPVNPYISVAAGHTYVLRAGLEGEELVVVHVTQDTRDILGVACRVVVDIVFEVVDEGAGVEYEVVEVTDDWFAQHVNGGVYYCGEVAQNFEDGVLRDLDGSFEAGFEFAKSGVLFRAVPTQGEAHRQEYALGEAEDIIQYLDLATAPSAEEGGDNAAFPCSPNNCVKTFDFAPLEPESTEFKYYLAGTGFVLAVGMEDGVITGEREELVCIGSSVDILQDAACEIADPTAVLDQLCKLKPDAFCGE